MSYKLYYFEARGRAEIIRFIFAYAGQEYEDVRFSKEDWPKYKAIAPFGQAPFLEAKINDQVAHLAQSNAIARYLANKFKIAGDSELERAEVEMYVEQINDLISELVKSHRETDETKKAEIQAKLGSEVLPAHFKLFETKLTKTNTGYLIGKSVTWADLYLTVVLEWLADKKSALLEHFPKVKAHEELIRNIPNLFF